MSDKDYTEFTIAEQARLQSTPSSLPRPTDGSLDTLQEFFVDDNGNFLILLPSQDVPIPPIRRPLSRVMSRASLLSVSTTSSLSTVSTAVPKYGVIDLSLADVCNYIDDHRSLQAAEIVSTECYSQAAGAVTHRFIILELRRQGRKVVWLRLDRRRGENVSLFRFLAVSGITKANDRGMLSANKEALIGEAFRENKQVFEVPPNLAVFARLLRIITEEIVSYRIWPENCWFFCSLIQQHLEGAQTGWFVNGILKYVDLANDIRTRISSRVWAERPTSHQPRPRPRSSEIPNAAPPARIPSPTPSPSYLAPPFYPSPTSANSTLRTPSPSLNLPPPEPYESPSAELIEKMEKLGKDETVEETVRTQIADALKMAPQIGPLEDTITRSQTKLCDKFLSLLDDIDTFISSSSHESDNLIFRNEAVRLQRALFVNTPLGERGDLARLLRNVGMALHRAKRSEEACVLDEEALTIRRENYRLRPSASRSKLAALLHSYSIHLYGCKRLQEACAANAEAVMLRKMLYELDPDEYREALATSLENYGVRLGSIQRFEDARIADEEALVLRREQYEKDPEEHRKDLSDCLHNYSITLDDLGMVRESRLALAECKTLRAALPDSSSSDSSSDSDSSAADSDD